MTSGSAKKRAEAARKALAAANKRDRRRRHLFSYSMVGLVVLIVVGVVLAVTLTRGSSPAAASGIPTTPAATAQGDPNPPPWAAPADATTRVKAAGLPMLDNEGEVVHIHAHLDVIVDGKPVTVPAGVGIDQNTGQLSPLHTHDTSGVIHVESPVQAEFSLGQFFTEWDVSLAADHLGSLQAGNDKVLQAYVNGLPVQGDPAAIVLHAHDEIALVYGTATQQTSPPATYTFPAGL
ncbi:hypothetical protein SAMN05421812_107248 [Asanoa hainanensis]|uniref:Uncharacterized protein n=1 Tax=Asanoa hainanensis TaxID=560556 RepID=A0A239N5P7_9ACTN|nr:hypothetical protein [Asanoa hainanensis]SNT49774.1 hypothetical protein SAMN05421812_107248 [Asanoa hainanensis]